MRRLTKPAIGALLAAAGIMAGGYLPEVPAMGLAGAQTAGHQRFDGFLVASGRSGTRQVVSSQVAGRGVFRGVGRIVEVQNRPGDPNNVSRDNLVFKVGTIHLLSTNLGATFSLNPKTCVFKATIKQRNSLDGGTGAFADVTGRFRGTVVARGVAARDRAGHCSQRRAPLLDVDVVHARGSMRF